MTTEVANANDFYVLSPESRRPIRTLKTYILLGWMSETFFFFFGMFMFPQLHPPLLGRLIWTEILCSIGMSSAVGAVAYMAASHFKQGSWPALIITGIVAGAAFSICGEVCYFIDTLPGVDYYGSHEMPVLFRLKGDIGGFGAGLFGSWLLNTKMGVSLLNKIPFLR
jgi:hypothetical protein